MDDKTNRNPPINWFPSSAPAELVEIDPRQDLPALGCDPGLARTHWQLWVLGASVYGDGHHLWVRDCHNHPGSLSTP